MRGPVLVAHPGRQHAHQAALALFEVGLLSNFITGVPSLRNHLVWVPRYWRIHFEAHGYLPLPEKKVQFLPIAPIFRKLGQKLTPLKISKKMEYLGYSLFDRIVALQLGRGGANMAICYENSALHTFLAARTRGISTVLDAASLHHATQDRLANVLISNDQHRNICKKKDAEVKLADLVLTCSEMARQSYLEAGVAPEKVKSVPLGVDLARFSPSVEFPASETVDFLYVGNICRQKGIDILLDAFARVRVRYPNARLRLVGGEGDATQLVRDSECNQISWRPRVSQQDLAEEYRKSHCLVLPSRFDSFGMVVAESLACGTPVIVSPKVGAKEILTDGSAGWVLGDCCADSLANLMETCLQDKEKLFSMRAKASAVALNWSWAAYRDRLRTALFG